MYIMTAQFTQPTTTASANGGTGGEAAINNRLAITAKASALAKVGGGRRRSDKRRISGKRRSNKRRISGKRRSNKGRISNKRSNKRRRSNKRKIYGGGTGGTEGPIVKGQSGDVANKLAIAQMASAENAKYDAKV